jgi:arginine deiminase
VLVVPIDQDRATMHLDTICTMVDVDAILMYPNVAHRLSAIAVRPGSGSELVVIRRRPSWRQRRTPWASPSSAYRYRARPGNRRA